MNRGLWRRMWCLLPLLAGVLTACGGGSESTQGQLMPMSAVLPLAAAMPDRGDTLRAREGTSPPARKLVLTDASRDMPAAQAASTAGPLTPRRVGFAREVAAAADTAATAAQLQWTTLPDGRHIAALSLTSPKAQGVRLGLLVRQLPAAATLRFYAQGSSTAQQIPAVDVLDELQRNRVAGETGDNASTYWAPLVEGPEATVEIELPARLAPEAVSLALPRLSHLDALPSSDMATTDTVQPKIGEAAACQVDVSCNPDYQNESNSVARLLFVQDGDSFVCTGTLLADKGASGTPYLLTANHCISAQTVASSLQTFWFYRSASCNVEVLRSDSRTVTGGAALLYASATTDTSFVRLNNRPPAGAVYAAWSPEPPATGNAVFGLHNPRGDLQKLSIGVVRSYERCQASPRDATELECSSDDLARSQFVDVRYTTGVTESGSSGSPLFRRVNGTSYVTGQLYGGSGSCQNRNGSNIYGRFDLAYTTALQRWLDGPAQLAPVYRFYNFLTGAHFYTINATERDIVIATDPNYLYEGPNFFAYNAQADGTSPVYRFYNLLTRAHFFTINEGERDYVRATDANYIYEGVAWYAQTVQQPGTTPLFHFYKLLNGTHFYTSNAQERAHLQATEPNFLDAGISYYVWLGL